MNTRIQPVSAFAVAVAALFATTAIADEGTVTAKVTSTGAPLQTIPVGKSGDRVFVSEEKGTIERGGPHPWRCVWMTFETASYDARGYCIEADQDGD